jgi:pimeloyl-ACP methyl ester carboxylesterase
MEEPGMPFATNPADGVRIHYDVVGSGKPVVMLHPMTTTGATWKRLGFLDLLEHGYQLILIDARSHGESDKPYDPIAHGGHTAMAADVVAVLNDARIDRAHAIGYSMGASTGYLLGQEAPERVRSLVLGGGPHTMPDAWVQGNTEILSQGREALLSMSQSSLGELEPERREEILQLDTQSLAAAVAAFASNPIPQEVFISLSAPCLLYVGADDVLAYEQVRQIAELIPDAELHILPGLDHYQAAIESSRMLPKVLEFFDRVELDGH